MHRFFKFSDVTFVSLCSLLTACLGIFLIGHKNFSMDELDTIFITKDWSTMLHIIRSSEGNMWLYYILVHFWQYFAVTENTLRLLSTLFAVATVPLLYLIGKNLFNTHIARMATFLFSIHVFLIHNAQNARGYTLVLLLSTLSSYLFIQYIHSSSRRLLLFATLVNVLAIYTHLYAGLVVAAQILSIVFIKNKKIWKDVLCVIPIICVLVSPLFLTSSIHSGQINWIARPNIKNLVGTFLILSNDFVPIAGIYVVLLSDFFLNLWHQRETWNITKEIWKYGFIFLWIIFPVVTAFGFSLFVKPIYISAYFFVCLVPFLLLVAICLHSISTKWITNTLLLLIVLLSFFRLYGWYTDSKTIGLVIRNYYEDWQGTATFLATHMKSTDAVIFLPPPAQENVQGKVNFYVAKLRNPPLPNEVPIQPDYLTSNNFMYMMDTTLDQNKLASLSSRFSRVWYVLETVTDKAIDQDNAIITSVLLKEYHLNQEVKLNAMTIFEYEK